VSEAAIQGGRVRWRALLGAEDEARPSAATTALDARRALQLVLAGIWLLDAVLQYQPFMYTKAFGQMLAGSAAGNPAVIARPIAWQAGLVEHHLVLLVTIFATIQLLIGLGIAMRPTVRVALAASVAWSLGVWWFGEGLGGVLGGAASPLIGAPGAVILYALLAVLLWPADRERPAPFIAARAVGAHAARALWLVLWLSLAYFALTPANRAPQAASRMIAGMEQGEPGWLAAIQRHAAALLAGNGQPASVVLAVVLVAIAIAVYLPRPAARAGLLLAIAAALVIWVVAEAFGGILAGGATDVNSGPLLALLAVAYWPARAAGTEPVVTQAAGGLPRPVPVAADAGVARALMGIAMAGMFAPGLSTLPNAAWDAIFGLMTAWFAWRAWLDARSIRGLLTGRCTLHAVHCAAMLYMVLALNAPAARGTGTGTGMGMGGPAMGTMQYPALAGAFALLLIGYSVRDLNQLTGRRHGLEAVLGIAMAFMLVVMI
jgi:hypothetical protein